MKAYCQFVGGTMAGTYPIEEVAPLASGISENYSRERALGCCVPRAELDDRPTFPGYLGPMWNGERGGIPVLRYETQEVYDLLSR